MGKELPRLPLIPRGQGKANAKFGKLDVIILIILSLYALSVIFPFYYAFIVSISSEASYMNNPIMIWPSEISFEAYKLVFENAQMWSGFKVTLFLLIVGTSYQLFFTVITGYALSRDRWLGKNFVMNMILVTMFFGGGLIPYYFLITRLFPTTNPLRSPLILIIPGAIDTFNMLLIRNYFASLPKEMEESAKIDGANDVQIFFKVYLPLSLPMLATIGLFFAVGQWNSWYTGMLFIKEANWKPLQLVLREIIVTSSSAIEDPNKKTYSEGLIMASIFFTIVPMMCFYPFLQRFFVKGIVVGAIKG